MNHPEIHKYWYWFDHPSVLWKPHKRLWDVSNWWPYSKSNQGDQMAPARCNALTRLVMVSTLLSLLITKFDIRALVVGSIAVALVVVAYAGDDRMKKKKKEKKNNNNNDQTMEPSDSPFQNKAVHRNPWEFIPTREEPTPDLLSVEAKCPDRDENPYCNPMPYTAPGAEVRSQRSNYQPEPEPWIDKLYRGSEDTPMNLYANRIPDPTLMARPVFWNFNAQPDIVSAQARVADRWMTY